ncbi:hypothetical protein OROGR_028602 [Orobanche gracilis]
MCSAINELNIKTKNWKELLTDEPFSKEDIIPIQNPNALDRKVLVDFDHVKKNLKIDDEELKKMESDPSYNINEIALHGGGGSKAIKERAAALGAVLGGGGGARIKDETESNNGEKPKQTYSMVDAASAAVHGRSAAAAKSDASHKTAARIAMHMAGDRTPVNAKLVKSRFTSGAASRSFTSTSYDPVTKNEYEYVKVEKNPKKKGYKNFMIQGGDPTGTGRGGESIWGKPFKDEFNSKLVHSGRGVVSMANSGPHTNGSQFFILYKSANHLNFKHTVFGMVVGGLTTLSAMEKVPVDDDHDRPLEEIKIISIDVFVNHYSESDEVEEAKTTNEDKKAEDEDTDKIGSWYSNPVTRSTDTPAVGGGGVGKYLKARIGQASSTTGIDIDAPAGSVVKKRKLEVSSGELRDFSSW